MNLVPEGEKWTVTYTKTKTPDKTHHRHRIWHVGVYVSTGKVLRKDLLGSVFKVRRLGSPFPSSRCPLTRSYRLYESKWKSASWRSLVVICKVSPTSGFPWRMLYMRRTFHFYYDDRKFYTGFNGILITIPFREWVGESIGVNIDSHEWTLHWPTWPDSSWLIVVSCNKDVRLSLSFRNWRMVVGSLK